MTGRAAASNVTNATLRLRFRCYDRTKYQSFMLLRKNCPKRISFARSGRVRYEEDTDTFHGSLSAVMRLAVRAIQELGFRIDSANENLGILTFQTKMTLESWSGALCSLSFEEEGSNVFFVRVSGKPNLAGLQLWALDLGSAKRLASDVVNRMADLAD